MIRMFRVLLGLCALTFCIGASAPPPPPPKPVVGQPAPDFELFLFDKSRIKLSEMRGQVIVLNFWATWCGPCRSEIPLLDTYYRLRKDRGLRMFAVATEDSMPAYRLKEFFAVVSYPQARKIKGPYDILGGVPTTYIIGRDGRLRYAKAAAFTLELLNRVLVPLLNEPIPPS